MWKLQINLFQKANLFQKVEKNFSKFFKIIEMDVGELVQNYKKIK